ncbi:MAG: hypothetical protein QGF90_16245 [Gammaproteobacteria bacterium]|nr:hypothetical protein [Gammaproteobacteria bacterium]
MPAWIATAWMGRGVWLFCTWAAESFYLSILHLLGIDYTTPD